MYTGSSASGTGFCVYV